MKCQTEGCDKDADFAVQVMSGQGYRVGMCKDCAIRELASVGITDPLDLLDSVYSHIITEADWWREHFFYNTPSQIPYINKEEYAKYVLLKCKNTLDEYHTVMKKKVK